MQITDTILKARKFYELSQRGEAGEKENASRMLERIMAAYNLKLEDIVDTTVERTFTVTEMVEVVILNSVIQSIAPMSRAWRESETVHCKLDEEDLREVQIKYEYFMELFESEYDTFSPKDANLRSLLLIAFTTLHREHFQPDAYAIEKTERIHKRDSIKEKKKQEAKARAHYEKSRQQQAPPEEKEPEPEPVEDKVPPLPPINMDNPNTQQVVSSLFHHLKKVQYKRARLSLN